MGRLLKIVVVLVLVGAAAACGDDESTVSSDGAGGTSGDGSSREPGGREDGLVVSIDVTGGLRPVGQEFRSLPVAAVYEDGTTLSPGAHTAIYPGPAVLPVIEGSVGGEEVASLVAAAAEAGLLEDPPPDLGETMVADAGTTTITVVAGGDTYVVSVHALQVADDVLPGSAPDANRAREEVQGFVELVSETVAGAGDAMYTPQRYRVLPLRPDEDVGEGIEPGHRDWPVPEVALTEGECTAVTGDDADELRRAVDDADEITRWHTDTGEVHALAIRAVLPHEPGCPNEG